MVRLSWAILVHWVAVMGRDSTSDCPSQCYCHETSDHDGVYVDCKKRKLTSIPTKFPLKTRTLDLSDNAIEFINELPDMDELLTLNLTSNKIRGIHYDAFDGLDSLETLCLGDNQLSSIDDDIFEWNPLKLKRIYLENNRFEYIQHFLFYDLAELEEINLSNNILYFVHPHAFTELENLRKLDLSNNNLFEFQTKWVKPLLEGPLYELHLDSNNFQCDCEMEDKIGFFDDSSLQSLLRSALYRGGSELKCSDSKNNNKHLWDMKTKDDLLPCQVPKITGISKSSSVDSGKSLLLKCIATGQPKPQIEWRAPNEDVYRLTSDDFEGVTVHQDGSMLIEDIRHSDDGEYTCIAKNSKGQIEAKTKITITGDDSEDIDRDDIDLDDDIYNDGHYWDITKEEIYNKDGVEIDNGKILDEDNSDYWDLDPESDKWIETKVHDCPDNCDCNTDMVDCSDAEDLDDNSRAFIAIPNRLPSTATHLDLNVNMIRRIGSDVCGNFGQLQELKLDENQITDISDDAFRSCKKMRILTLRENKLTKLREGMFRDLREVQILVLDNNFLESIPDFAFQGMDELEYLYIRENRISHIGTKAFHGLKQIRFIHLEGNKIEALDRNWIEDAATNSNLKRIFLEENNLVCDTRMSPFKNDFSRQESQIYKIMQPADLECSYPIEMAGKSLDIINFDVLVVVEPGEPGTPSGGNAGLLIGGIFLGIVLTALIFVVWRKWNRGHNLRHGMYSYQDINQDDDARAHLTAADQEAFI